MTKCKTGPATSGDSTKSRTGRRARSTDSSTLQRAALSALARFIEDKHSELTSADANHMLAVRGDANAARAVLARFIEQTHAHCIVATKAEAWPDLRAAVDVVTLLLAQSSASTGTALGFQGLRTTRASRIVGLVVFFAVDHAQYAMGEVRTVDDASKMVAATTARLVSVVFPRAMSAGAVLKIFNRVKAADPMGWSPLLQRARRLQDI